MLQDFMLSERYIAYREGRRNPVLRCAGGVLLGALLLQIPIILLGGVLLYKQWQNSRYAHQLNQQKTQLTQQFEPLKETRARYQQERDWQNWASKRKPASALLAKLEQGFTQLPMALQDIDIQVEVEPNDKTLQKQYPAIKGFNIELTGYWEDAEAGAAALKALFAPIKVEELPTATTTHSSLKPFHVRWHFSAEQLPATSLALEGLVN